MFFLCLVPCFVVKEIVAIPEFSVNVYYLSLEKILLKDEKGNNEQFIEFFLNK